MVEVLKQGGIMVIPIIGVAVLALYLVFYRWFDLRQLRRKSVNITPLIDLLEQGDYDTVRERLMAVSGTFGNLLRIGLIAKKLSPAQLENRLRQVYFEEIGCVHSYLTLIQLIASVLPMLGLLGTVTGMITVFKVIAVSGVGNAQALSGGISEALITTQLGLALSIPVLFGHRWVSGYADGIDLEMKRIVTAIMQLNKGADHVG